MRRFSFLLVWLLLPAPAAVAQGITGYPLVLSGRLTTGGALTIANLTTANQLLYVTSANNVGGLATANSGVLVTDGSGVPSISATIPSGIAFGGAITGNFPLAAGALINWGGNVAIAAGTGNTVLRPANNTGGNGVAFQTFGGVNTLLCAAGLCTFGNTAPVHIAGTQTTAPALTSCGTGSPTISGTDTAGTVTMGTSATGCVITFNAAYSAAPYCTVTWRATPLASQSYTVSATAITTTQTSTSGNLLDYHCIARSGG